MTQGTKRIAIVGAGLGGLCTAIKFQEAGYRDFTIFERNPRVGGVWHENSYPGCACDVPVALYQMSFAPSMNWSRLYPQSEEIQAYTEEVADRYQLGPHIKLNTEVTKAEWQEDKGVWRVETGDGTVGEYEILVAALGQLNRPSWPDIPGRDAFKGASMHSARWDHSVDYAGKRVGVIGSAASAVQLIPEVAKTAGHVTVFQRTPNWMIPRFDRAITDEEKQLMMTDLDAAMELAAANRKIIYENADRFFWQAFQWTQEGRNAYTRLATNHLNDAIDDPELRKKLTPDYPVGCKRILICDDFYPSLLRENVELVTEGIDRIDAAGVATKDGRHHDFDILVYATGFETTGWQWSMDVIGREGKHLHTEWGDVPEAYLGITVQDFPNMFVLYGPNTNLGHNSITFMLECQADYALQAVQMLDSRGAKALAPTPEAQARYNKELQDKLAGTVWADEHCSSWYKTEDGKITQNWSSHTRDYAAATKAIKPEDYEVV